ncbi:MAG TPA: PASTA domain-containing protein [Gaiellaceae bacterium]|nr:PASTA domain-containing protein [Gaiellaceae bacterium]
MTEETAVAPPARGRYVHEEVVTPPPRRPLLWPWLVLLLGLVIAGIAAAYFLTRDDGSSATKPHVPAVVGLSTAVATQQLGQRGYATIVRGQVVSGARLGTVLSQTPPPGTALDSGGQVTIVVAHGPSTVDVPNVVGLPVDQAFVRLQAAGLKGQTVKVASAQPKDRVIRQAPAGGSQAKKSSTVVLTVSKGPSSARVPALRGLTQASATATLSRLGFRVSVSQVPAAQPKGIVFSQAPAPGSKAPKGSIVGINVSTGGKSAAGGVVVPKVVGLSQGEAVDRIEQVGLTVDSFPVASQQPRGTVASERPAGGTQVAPRSKVRINVSLGPGPREQRDVPDVVGQAESAARHALIQAGFTVRSVDQPTSDPGENGLVIKQKPVGGGQASVGSQVAIYVGRGPGPSG